MAIKPKALTTEEAASIPLVGLTASTANVDLVRSLGADVVIDYKNEDFAGASWVLRIFMGFVSYGIRAKAKRRRAHYSFLFMRANGGQLAELTSLIDNEIIRPVVDRVFPFASTKEAMAYVEAGRAKGKVVVSLR